MWLWVLLFVVISVAGTALLAVLAWRLYGKARALGRTVADATEALHGATEALERATGVSGERPDR